MCVCVCVCVCVCMCLCVNKNLEMQSIDFGREPIEPINSKDRRPKLTFSNLLIFMFAMFVTLPVFQLDYSIHDILITFWLKGMLFSLSKSKEIALPHIICMVHGMLYDYLTIIIIEFM